MIIWTEYTNQNLPTGKYLVERKDGKIHFERYNGTGFAYNDKVIVSFSTINNSDFIPD